ncbi:MAG: FtsW/RodA/SpoVE family cell cycle protein, partial [Polyangiaceae bacterium]
GFVGIVGMCGMYTLIVARGMKVATQAMDDYGAYIAFGISALLAMQVLLNLAVAMAIIPTKGLTLPFISYGGSSLLVSGASIGILLSISRRRQDHRSTSADGGPDSTDDIQESASAVVATAAESGGSGW